MIKLLAGGTRRVSTSRRRQASWSHEVGYAAAMDPADLRAFAHRARLEVEQQKRAHWVQRFHEGDGNATLRAAHALYDYVRRVRPDYPTEQDRAEDLAHHIALKQLIDRASRALAVR